MIKTKRLKLFSLILALFLLLTIPFTVKPVLAEEETVDFEKTNVLDDLKSSPDFNILKYPFYSSSDTEMYVINVVEYCYSFDPAKQDNYGLYLYIYNPNGIILSVKDGDNTVQIATGYNEDGTPNFYEKFNLKFCSKSTDQFYENLFYKFKVVDKKSPYDGKTIVQRVKSSERRYDISGVQLLDNRLTLPTGYKVGGTYKFTGYAKGLGANPKESTLNCTVIELETIELYVHKTFYRTGEYATNHRHDLTSVYFAVPERFFERYGSLQKIRAEWYEYQTTPMAITSNTTVYNGLKEQIGVDVTQQSVPISLYSNWRELSGSSGHYDKYDFGYNVEGEVNDRLNTLNYVFSTDGKSISQYVLYSNYLQQYIEAYDKTYVNGKIEIPGKSLSADLFEPNLDDVRASVPYYGKDVHHKLMTFDADDKFDMLNYNDTTTDGYRFLAKLFGLAPTELDESYRDISPIHVVTDEERKDSNISKTLLIGTNEDELEHFKSFYDTSKANGKRTVLFRFAQTDYSAIPVIAYNEKTGDNLSGGYGKDTFVVKESVFLNFDIIELTFSRDGVYTVIPVVSSPIDIYNDITIPKVEEKDSWLKTLLIILFVILLVIFLWVTGLLPLVLKIIFWIILLPFRIIFWLLKAIFKGRKKKTKQKEPEEENSSKES